MSITITGRTVLASLLFLVTLWAMTDCGGKRICRLRGGAVSNDPSNFENWRCLP